MGFPALIASGLGALASSESGAILGAAGLQGLSNIFQNSQNRALSRQQMEWNERMLDKQNAFSEYMWNQNNKYNSPVEQIKRLLEAGLNPLYYGLDGSSANSFTSASALPYQQPSAVNPLMGIDPLNTIERLQNIKESGSRIQKNIADTAKSIAERMTEDATRDGKVQSLYCDIEIDKLHMKEQVQHIAEMEAGVQMIYAQIEKIHNDIDISQKQQLINEMRYVLEQLIADRNYDISQKEVAVHQFNAMTQRIVGDSTAALNAGQLLYVNAQTGKVEQATQIELDEFNARKPTLKANAWINTAGNAVGVISDVVSTFTGIKSIATIGKTIMSGKSRTTEHYDKNGQFTGSTVETSEDSRWFAD